MPLCQTCSTYYSTPPCPTCQRRTNPSHIVNIVNQKERKSKVFWLSSSPEELDFIWAQITHRTNLRKQFGQTMLRRGYLNVDSQELKFKMECIGSTFTQEYLHQLERFYPGTNYICILADTMTQRFHRESLQEILEDIINVNKKWLKHVYLIFLDYPNTSAEIRNFKFDISRWLKESLSNYATFEIESLFKEFFLPIYPDIRFANALAELLNHISQSLTANLSLPLRPLFRIRPQLSDIIEQPRVVILELEQPSETVYKPKSVGDMSIKEYKLSSKCLACNKNLKPPSTHCRTCNSVFCAQCLIFQDNSKIESNDFCLGSIYFGLHKANLRIK